MFGVLSQRGQTEKLRESSESFFQGLLSLTMTPLHWLCLNWKPTLFPGKVSSDRLSRLPPKCH